VITIALSTVIGAERERVWRALTRPGERIRWDERLVELLDPAGDAPAPGRRVRWRYRLGALAVELQESPLEVRPPERLHCDVALGLFRFSVVYTLGVESGAPAGAADRTQLSLRLSTENSMPVVGGTLDRFDVRRVASEYLDAQLRALQKWCESAPDAGPAPLP
jgi:hypothetical protein